MSTLSPSSLTSRGFELEMSPETFGILHDSHDIFHDGPACQARFREQGYLFFRDVLDREQILEGRRVLCERLASSGYLHPDHPLIDGVCNTDKIAYFMPDLTKDNQPLLKVLYTGAMMDFYSRFLGGPVRHYDFTWLRAVSESGQGINPHCDIVYMGRGTFNVFTSWTPFGTIPREMGGLMILEKSHLHAPKLNHYLHRDVDTYCTNGRHAAEIESGKKWWEWSGALANNPVHLRNKLGGRWLTADYEMGDLLVFGMSTIHASLDNHTNRMRLSTDSRYQLASEPVDERWVGENPIGHNQAGKRGRIC
ncbi:MAG: phytanoyl-CoA dioxygenase family protein [Verrucomicrobiae bacterium]|nr:phytanoyl-CoA dioxygenase family protein [Verrucomicrobiae bacterium]